VYDVYGKCSSKTIKSVFPVAISILKSSISKPPSNDGNFHFNLSEYLGFGDKSSSKFMGGSGYVKTNGSKLKSDSREFPYKFFAVTFALMNVQGI